MHRNPRNAHHSLTFRTVCEGTSCSECLNQAGCGWCAPTQTCVNGDFDGPTDDSYCLSGWFGNLPVGPPSPERCPGTSDALLCAHIDIRSQACSIVPSCLECTHTSGCGWCAETKACVEVTGNPSPNCTPVDYCRAFAVSCSACLTPAACQDYTQCYQCLAQATCTYCSKTMRCDNAGENSCGGGPQLKTCGTD